MQKMSDDLAGIYLVVMSEHETCYVEADKRDRPHIIAFIRRQL